jgi:hypothetical protein
MVEAGIRKSLIAEALNWISEGANFRVVVKITEVSIFV